MKEIANSVQCFVYTLLILTAASIDRSPRSQFKHTVFL